MNSRFDASGNPPSRLRIGTRRTCTDVVTVVSASFVVIGAGLSVRAWRAFLRRRAFLRDSLVATGVIVALTENRERDEISYFPRIRFRSLAGHDITFQSGAGSSAASWRTGGTVVVCYRKDRPEIAEVGSFAALWGPTLLFAGLGVIFLFVGIGILVGWLPVEIAR